MICEAQMENKQNTEQNTCVYCGKEETEHDYEGYCVDSDNNIIPNQKFKAQKHKKEKTLYDFFSKTQRGFMLKAIDNISTLYDFDNTTDKEFKECYGITKAGLIIEIKQLRLKILNLE